MARTATTRIAFAVFAWGAMATAEAGTRYSPRPLDVRPPRQASDPRSPGEFASQGSLQLLGYEGSRRNTGVGVWQAVDGEIGFFKDVAPVARFVPREVEVARYAPAQISAGGVSPYVTTTRTLEGYAEPTQHPWGSGFYGPHQVNVERPVPQPETQMVMRAPYSTTDMDAPITPVRTPVPTVLPATDFFGRPPLDKLLADTIPANASDIAPIDPERFNATPIALFVENKTIKQIMYDLVPTSYHVSYDIRPDLYNEHFTFGVEKPWRVALDEIGSALGVQIIPYHKSKRVLVTDKGAVQ